ncbi:pentapeptide repeat-containing protein [Amycolatopsis sp. MtRt-6]|uniref:pentapeptide repeat-containing protein n=1 Tax=Amycolatopsis sp. MtRt-6 TaxID=2792782 RepID=UPI001A8ECE5F|nr:pentapeptide repeat-containing protein [Amycolatopsis sp. MtRt-6]
MSDWLRWLLIAFCLLLALIVVGQGRRRHKVVRRVRRKRARSQQKMAVSVLGWLVVALVVAGATGGSLLWFLGWPRLPSAQAFDVGQLLDLLKIALSVVAGFGGVVLLAVNFRKQRVAEDEHALAVQRADREVVQKFNERFGSAAEQLANESPAVRLAGVYAMAGLADDWADKRQVCVDVLCGYLRITREGDGETEVREAILRMVRDHTRASAKISWSALDFDFTGVTLENADFARLEFRGEVLFDGAEFVGGLASFAGAEFGKLLSFHGTRFAAAETTFAGATFARGKAEFVGAEFAGDKTNFADALFQSSSVAFFRCRFTAPVADFSQLDFLFGRVVFDRCGFADLELDFSSRFGYGTEGMLLTAENCRFERCRLELSRVAGRIRFLDCVLDTVTVVDRDDEQVVLPWRRVELRGGTLVPPHLSAAKS